MTPFPPQFGQEADPGTVTSLVQALRNLEQPGENSLKGMTDPARVRSLLSALGLSSPIPIGQFDSIMTRAQRMLQPRNLQKAGIPQEAAEDLKTKMMLVYRLLSDPESRRHIETLVGPLAAQQPEKNLDRLSLPKVSTTEGTATKKASGETPQSKPEEVATPRPAKTSDADTNRIGGERSNPSDYTSPPSPTSTASSGGNRPAQQTHSEPTPQSAGLQKSSSPPTANVEKKQIESASRHTSREKGWLDSFLTAIDDDHLYHAMKQLPKYMLLCLLGIECGATIAAFAVGGKEGVAALWGKVFSTAGDILRAVFSR